MKKVTHMPAKTTIGMDISDRKAAICILDPDGEECVSDELALDRESMLEFAVGCSKLPDVIIAMESGTHSRWLSNLFESHGIRVLVGNPRKLRMIWDSDCKDDCRDAQMLARIARFDQRLLYPIRHRNIEAQEDLAIIKCRDLLVQNRAKLINSVRGQLKSFGVKVPSCSAPAFAGKAREFVPGGLRPAMFPILDTIRDLSERIRDYDREVEKVSLETYPETQRLQQIKGVGPLTALAFVLTLESSDFLRKNRDVGPYLGLVPRRDKSGTIDKQLSITKAGNGPLRRLLVGAAQYILGPFGEDCDLRRAGERIAGQGDNKIRKKKAVVAVARKLSVLMHALWRNQSDYIPLRKENHCQEKLAS